MKSFATLIKLQKTYVDEQRNQLARLLDRLDQIDAKIAQLEIRKAAELAAAQDGEARATYGAFLRSMVEQGRALDKDRHVAQQAVKIAQEKLAELFEEQKRYEIAEQQRLLAEERAEQRLETIELDEVGGMAHERKRSE